MFNRPTDLALTDAWIAAVVKLKSQGGIGRRADNVFCLMNIHQGVREGARSGKARRASRGGRRGVADLACRGKRRQGQGTQPRRALSPSGKLPNALNGRTGTRL